jgi:hypothetical protein
MDRARDIVGQLVQEALPPEFAMPERLSPEGQRGWKIITDFLRQRRLTHSGGHTKVFYSPDEWKAKGEDETGGELFIVHDGGEHARAISWEAEDEKTRERLQSLLRPAGLFMEQLTYVTSGLYKIGASADPKPEPEPTAVKQPEAPTPGLESAVRAAREFLNEDDFPPVGVNRRRSPRDRLARLRQRRGEDKDGKPIKEGDAQPGYDVPHEQEEHDEIALGQSILKHIELLRAAIPEDTMLPPGVIKNLDIIKRQAEQLLSLHGADTEVALESTVGDLLDSDEDDEDNDNTPIEAYGVRGMKSTPWRKRFKNRKALNAWVEKGDGDIEVHATRKAD